MAKIDLTKIEGYADMTPEQKLAALEAFELPAPDYTGYVPKTVFDKKASEAAKYKEQLDGKMTEDEKANKEKEEKMAALEDEVATLKREKTISGFKAKFIAEGYDEELATKTAEALEKGDNETVFANHKKFLEAFEKKIRTDALGNVGKPPAGDGNGGDGKKTLAEKLGEEKAAAMKAAQKTIDFYK